MEKLIWIKLCLDVSGADMYTIKTVLIIPLLQKQIYFENSKESGDDWFISSRLSIWNRIQPMISIYK